jgi:endonuclease/exonuclease/phosphatase family metal-dependent hydrolase
MRFADRLAGNIWRWVIGVLVVAVCGGCAGAAKKDAAGDGGLELSVMTFNIRYGSADDGENRWEKRREMVFDVVRRYRPDVLGLQEALKFQIDEICAATPEYAMIGVGRDDGKTKGEYSAILYRRDRFEVEENGTFWLSDTPETPGSITWGNACTRICTWGRFVEKKSGKAFYHYNLHLDHVSQPSREKSMVLVAERIAGRKKPDAFIVSGDFNSGEKNPVVLFLKGERKGKGDVEVENPVRVVDTFRVVHPEAEKVRTAHGFNGTDTGEKIDYILTTPDAKVLGAEILHDNTDGRYPSDHFPVTARVRLPAGRNDE